MPLIRVPAQLYDALVGHEEDDIRYSAAYSEVLRDSPALRQEFLMVT